VAVHPRFQPNTWHQLRSFALEVDPGFSALSVDSLLLHMLGDVFTFSHRLTKLKVCTNFTKLRPFIAGKMT
jgi:hypothetical protein